MANVVSIRILFESEELAERALPIAAGMIKLLYVPKNLPWAAEAEQIASLSKRYFRFDEEAAAVDPYPEHPYCSLKRLHREGAQILLERCADIQSPVDVFWPGDFFSQLCLTLTKRFPDTLFTAYCRHEETVSATVQLNRIKGYAGWLFCTEMWRLDGDETDEDDWSQAVAAALRDTDGVIQRPPRN